MGGVWASKCVLARGKTCRRACAKTLSQDRIAPVDQTERRPGWQGQGEPGEGEGTGPRVDRQAL